MQERRGHGGAPYLLNFAVNLKLLKIKSNN